MTLTGNLYLYILFESRVIIVIEAISQALNGQNIFYEEKIRKKKSIRDLFPKRSNSTQRKSTSQACLLYSSYLRF